MPELPEVETVARQLSARVEGRVIRRLTILDDLLRRETPPPLAGAVISSVFRAGKQVIFELTHDRRPPWWLAVHLRMTGRLLVHENPRLSIPHLRARFRLDQGSLLFVDTRRFGTFGWRERHEDILPNAVEPLSRRLTPRRFRQLIGNSRSPIKTWLLRQDRLVGLGNIYASEILHEAHIAPQRHACDLDDEEIANLTRATKKILRRAIRNCGTTFSDFQDADGVEGSYQNYLFVYGRDGEGCRRCDGTIEREVQQQRSTFYCRRCQH